MSMALLNALLIIFYNYLLCKSSLKAKISLLLTLAFLPRKHELVYERCFGLIKKHTGELKDIKLQCDFERSIWNGFNVHFGKVVERKRVVSDFGGIIEGCYFHFVQAVYRNIRDKGFEVTYRDSKEFRQAFYRTKALCFAPVNSVVSAFNIVKEDAPVEYDAIIKYLETYSIGDLINPDCKEGLRKVPFFPIPTWKCARAYFERPM